MAGMPLKHVPNTIAAKGIILLTSLEHTAMTSSANQEQCILTDNKLCLR